MPDKSRYIHTYVIQLSWPVHEQDYLLCTATNLYKALSKCFLPPTQDKSIDKVTFCSCRPAGERRRCTEGLSAPGRSSSPCGRCLLVYCSHHLTYQLPSYLLKYKFVVSLLTLYHSHVTYVCL